MERYQSTSSVSRSVKLYSWLASWLVVSIVLGALGTWQSDDYALGSNISRWTALAFVLLPVTYLSTSLYVRGRGVFVPFAWSFLAFASALIRFLAHLSSYSTQYLAQYLFIPAVVFFLVGLLYVALLHIIVALFNSKSDKGIARRTSAD